MKKLIFKVLAVTAVVITLSSCDTLDLTGPGPLEPPTVDRFTPGVGLGQGNPFGWGRPKPGRVMEDRHEGLK